MNSKDKENKMIDIKLKNSSNSRRIKNTTNHNGKLLSINKGDLLTASTYTSEFEDAM
jgi:hypothetical protein